MTELKALILTLCAVPVNQKKRIGLNTRSMRRILDLTTGHSSGYNEIFAFSYFTVRVLGLENLTSCVLKAH